MEGISKSPVGGVIENVISVARPALAVGSALVASASATTTGLVVAGGIVGGLGIVDWFRKLGSSKVSENLEALGQATEDALNRLENTLREHGTDVDKIKTRIESDEFKNGMASAVLQALRTTQENRLTRMALILANGVKENDLEPESLDDMMRAAVELKETDIVLLGEIYHSQVQILKNGGLSSEWSQQVANQWNNDFASSEQRHLDIRSSLSRLESVGLIGTIRTNVSPDGSFAHQAFGLLLEGKKFYERLQEIAIPK
jgi:hypothetical protein